jgi:hypothetical protein
VFNDECSFHSENLIDGPPGKATSWSDSRRSETAIAVSAFRIDFVCRGRMLMHLQMRITCFNSSASDSFLCELAE